MRNASSHQSNARRKERQWKKVNENIYDISSTKSITKKFREVSCCSRAKQRQIKEMYKKSTMLHVQSWCFANSTYWCFFHRSLALPSPLSITQFYILFERTINIIKSFTFSLGWIYILLVVVVAVVVVVVSSSLSLLSLLLLLSLLFIYLIHICISSCFHSGKV